MTMTVIARRTVRAIAKLQDRDVQRAVGRSGVLASRLWRMATNAAYKRRIIGANGDKRVPPLDPELIQAATEELTDIMAYAYLLRIKLTKRRRSISKRAIVLASPVHKLAAQVADNMDLDLGRVRARFQGVAGKAITKTVSDIRNTMNDALAKATKDSLPTPQATQYVIGRLRKHGIEPRTSSYVETLVRTHAAISYGAGHRQSFLADADGPWGYEYVTVGDDRVRPEHEELDGVVRKADDPFWEKFWPPNGWNCRCQAVAIYDDNTAQTRIPSGVEPDEGFDTDFTELL